MGAEQIVVLVLLVAAFAAGRFSVDPPRRRRRGEEEPANAPPAPAPASASAPASAPVAAPEPARAAPAATLLERPDPVAGVLRALDRAVTAWESATDRWIDERDAITPAGRAAIGEVGRALSRLDAAVERLREAEADPERSQRLGAAEDARDALRAAAGLLDRFRDGQPLDAETNRELSDYEDEVERARDDLAGEG